MRVVLLDRCECGRIPTHAAPRAVRSVVATGWRLRTVAIIAWAAWTSCATNARAAPRTFVTIEYDVAPDASGCPDVEEFRASVHRQLGYDPFRRTADRRVAVRIARKETGFNGFIKWSDAHGRWAGDRRLSSVRAECSEIATNLAFSVVVQIQLLAALAPDKPPEPERTVPSNTFAGSASSSGASSKPSPDSTPSSDTPSNASLDYASRASAQGTSASPEQADAGATPPSGRGTTPRGTRFRLFAGLGPSFALGTAPHATAIGRAFASGRLDWFSLELSIDAALPATGTGPEGSGFSLNRYAASSAACGHIGPFAGCLAATVGHLEAHGLAVDRPATSSGTFTALGARIAARQDFGRYFASVHVDGLVMTSTWTVMLNDTAAWTTPRLGGLLGLDFGIDIF
jgi:hypothetical protein